MLAGNFSHGVSKYLLDYTRSEAVPIPVMPLKSVESTYYHAVTAKHVDMQSQNRGSFGNIDSCNLTGQSVLRATQ